jgi:hypothetical protein
VGYLHLEFFVIISCFCVMRNDFFLLENYLGVFWFLCVNSGKRFGGSCCCCVDSSRAGNKHIGCVCILMFK